MPTPILPTIIQGPAVVVHNGYSYYSQGAVELKLARSSFDVQSAYGRLDTRHTSQQYDISFTPVGEVEQEAFAAMFPLGVSDIGKSIFPASPSLVIHSLAENLAYTFHRAGIKTSPNLDLVPNKTLFGPITFVALGKANTLPTDAAFIKTIGGAASFGVGFDQDKVITDIYKATFGALTLGSLDGFKLAIQTEVKEIVAADIGIVDIILMSLNVNCEFAPDNVTQAQMDDLLGLQGSSALFPGQSYARNETDLVIESTGGSSPALKVTLKKMGPKESDHTYEIGTHQHKRLTFTHRRNFSGGVAQPLWLFEVS